MCRAQTGDVFVEAKSFNDTATGPYHLSVTATVLPPDAVGNDASTRARINAGAPANGSLDYPGDVDWYRFSARTGQMYTITLAGDARRRQSRWPIPCCACSIHAATKSPPTTTAKAASIRR